MPTLQRKRRRKLSLAKEWKPAEYEGSKILYHKKTGRQIILGEGKSALDPEVIELMTRVGGSIEPATMRSTAKTDVFGTLETIKNASVCTQVSEIKHGKEPIYVVADAAGKKYVFKELVQGSEIYWQNYRYDLICREIGWAHLTPRVAWKDWGAKTGMLVEFFENAINVATLEDEPIGKFTVMDKVDPTDVIRAALLDGLCVSRDKHSNNVMIDTEGRIGLIDNTHCFKRDDLSRSIFVGTRPTKKTPNLYYKFFVKGGVIGTSLPPEYRAYLKKLSTMGVDQLCLDFHFDDADKAIGLRNRAKDIMSLGFEKVCLGGNDV